MADNLFTRDDTFFGVCEGLGQDLHIPANLLRIAFAVGLLESPRLTVALYFGLGVLVMVSRLVFPQNVRKRTVRAAAPAPAPALRDNDALPEYAEAA